MLCEMANAIELIEGQQPEPESIAELGLSNRTRNALGRSGVRTIEQLLKMSEDEILMLRDIGRTNMTEIRTTLSQRGLELQKNNPQ